VNTDLISYEVLVVIVIA